MKVKDIMTPNPACCEPETSLRKVAEMLVDHDCGADKRTAEVLEHVSRPRGRPASGTAS
jgi:CBS domain-containing protein